MRKFLFFLALLIFVACGIKQHITVIPVNLANKYMPNALIYSLPATKIIVIVEVRKIIENKAPLADYSEKYLGPLKNVIRENKTYWEFSDIKFMTIPQVDTSQIYVINSNCSNLTDYINISREGFLISFNSEGSFSSDIELPENQRNYKNYGFSELSFAQISVDKTFKEVYDTIYKQENYDTVFKLVPIIKKNVIKKSLDEQAKELAEQIFTLRDDRAALLVGEGDSEYLPDGDALEIMLNGIDKLEKQYLEMFTGRRDTITLHYIFSFVPKENLPVFQKILFRFSKNKGVLPVESMEGQPVVLEMQSGQTTDKITDFVYNQELYKSLLKEKGNGLYYRIPEKVTVKLKYKNSYLGQKDIYVAQLGTVLSLPERLFYEKNLKIEFYPELGSIKRISKQQTK